MSKLVVEKGIFLLYFLPCLIISSILFPIGVACLFLRAMSVQQDVYGFDWLCLLLTFAAIPVFSIGAILQFINLKRKGIPKRECIVQTIVFAISPIFVIILLFGLCWVINFVQSLIFVY